MNIHQFKEDIISNYMDSDGLVSPVKNPGFWSTGNGLLYMGLFYFFLAINKTVEIADEIRFLNSVDSCYVSNTKGLLNRNPGRPDLEAQDDYIGVCAASCLLDTEIAKEVCEYGKRNFYSYDNTSPNHFSLRTCHLRFFTVVPFYKLCSGKNIPFSRFVVLLRLIFGSIPKSSSDCILLYIQLNIFKKLLFLNNIASRYEKKMLSQFGGEAKNMFIDYFGAEHPFSNLDKELYA